MDSTTISSTSTKLTTTEDSYENIVVKLRRLKIEESLLCKSIRTKIKELTTEENEDNCYENYTESTLKHSFLECRDLFEEIKINTNCQENLQSADIEDIKKDVINLETKVQQFKTSLQTHLTRLKETEKEFTGQVDQNPHRLRRSEKTPTKAFSDIVPSPVKILIKSGFKCLEVQEFQEFMSNSKNRYGGWIPYSHDIFEKTWHKYFSTQKNIEDFEYQDVNVENSELFQHFLYDVRRKIPEAEINDIIAHNKWYTKYIFLKQRQQRALEKWRMKKQIRHRTKFQTGEDKRVQKVHRNDKYLNSLISDQLKEIKNKMFAEIESRDVLEKEDARHFTLELLHDTRTCSGENAFKNEHGQCEQIHVPKTEVQNICNKLCKTSARQSKTYKNPTQQWNNRCNEDKGHKERINGVENIQKR